MSASVNLVPQSCRIARQRSARRNRWIAVATSGALMLALGGFVRISISGAVSESGERLAHLQARQLDLDRQLGMVLRTRAALYEQVRSIAALRHSQPTPEQFVALAAAAPDGVLLTDLRAEAAVAPVEPQRQKSAAPVAAAAKPGSPASQPVATPLRSIHLTGYALNHEQLNELIENMRRIPNWHHVELLRAARESYGGGEAIAFRVECRERSHTP